MQVLSFYLLLSLLLINVNDSKHYNYPKCCFSNTLMVSKKPQIHNISMEIIIVGYTYTCGFLLFYVSLVKLRWGLCLYIGYERAVYIIKLHVQLLPRLFRPCLLFVFPSLPNPVTHCPCCSIYPCDFDGHCAVLHCVVLHFRHFESCVKPTLIYNTCFKPFVFFTQTYTWLTFVDLVLRSTLYLFRRCTKQKKARVKLVTGIWKARAGEKWLVSCSRRKHQNSDHEQTSWICYNKRRWSALSSSIARQRILSTSGARNDAERALRNKYSMSRQ